MSHPNQQPIQQHQDPESTGVLALPAPEYGTAMLPAVIEAHPGTPDDGRLFTQDASAMVDAAPSTLAPEPTKIAPKVVTLGESGYAGNPVGEGDAFLTHGEGLDYDRFNAAERKNRNKFMLWAGSVATAASLAVVAYASGVVGGSGEQAPNANSATEEGYVVPPSEKLFTATTDPAPTTEARQPDRTTATNEAATDETTNDLEDESAPAEEEAQNPVVVEGDSEPVAEPDETVPEPETGTGTGSTGGSGSEAGTGSGDDTGTETGSGSGAENGTDGTAPDSGEDSNSETDDTTGGTAQKPGTGGNTTDSETQQ